MNRNSTPEASTASSLRPPSSRTVASNNHHLRASADMAALAGPATSNRIRPSSDFYGQQGQGQGAADADPQDKVAQQWIADIDQYETTLEEMAAATLDQDFKDELSAIEQWFRVLSEAERTAALYALLQQTTQVQIRFFIQVLQQMGKNHPMSGVLSPANFDKDPMSNRLSDAMNKLNVGSARNSLSQPQASTKRHSGLDPSTINAMFPDAAAAIATEKAKFTQQTGNQPPSNRNSTAVDIRSPLGAPTISAPTEGLDPNAQNPTSPWINSHDQSGSRPKSSSGQTPMGQFVQPPPSAGLRSPRPQLGGSNNIQSTTLNAPDKSANDLPILSPYAAGSGNWASMVNTPMVPTFNTGNSPNQADMVANATAMKLAALSTVNNRFALDDVRKYRRARSNDAPGQSQNSIQSGHQASNIPGTNIIMVNEHGQVLNRDQMLALQNHQIMGGFAAHRSRPNSPGIAMQGFGQVPFASPQNNGFLSAYDSAQNPLLNNGLGAISMGQLGVGVPEGYLSDHSDMVRGRSPRGRRGTSKPPEDPTDPTLLQDIPAWLRSLRLHKYTDNLKDMKWTDLIELDDKALEDRGVNALGARRKMLKVFEQVKEAKADGKLG
ncbi:protein VTS1 [Daldinia grandis]|nr:protein VTS1 [Daldinia grandis]